MVFGSVKIFLGAVLISAPFLSAQAQVTVSLSGLGGNPDYRWRDTPGNLYAVSFRNSFEYGSAPAVTLTYSQTGEEFTGTLTGVGMKPNFTYQLKLEGKPVVDWGSTQGDDWSNQQLQNLGRVWDNIGYLVFDYLITDENGNFSKSFTLNSSYHVLYRTDQRTRQADDGPVITRDVVVDSTTPAYDTTLATESVGVYGERESGRPAPGSVLLPDGNYRVRVILTEESFHESGLEYGGNWAAAMGYDDIQFTIGDPLPILLGSFTVKFAGPTNVRLEWVTLTEVNNFGFEVEKSARTQTGYKAVLDSFLPGHGTTVERHVYLFTDANATQGTWFYRLKQIDLDGAIHYSDAIHVEVYTGVSEESPPEEFALIQNFPNPFNPSTTIKYEVPKTSHVSLSVYDVLGRQVFVLVDERMEVGVYEVRCDASALSSGVYFYRLRADAFVSTKRMSVVK